MTALEMRKAANAGEREAAFQTAYNEANHTPISDILAQHFCYCRSGAICVFCLGCHRLLTRRESRMTAGGGSV